jgi:Zn-finger nucleic acid-binding protein
MSQATAVLKSNAVNTMCRACKAEIVLTRNSNVIKTYSMCPRCGAGIKHIWITEA